MLGVSLPLADLSSQLCSSAAPPPWAPLFHTVLRLFSSSAWRIASLDGIHLKVCNREISLNLWWESELLWGVFPNLKDFWCWVNAFIGTGDFSFSCS